MCVLSVVAIRTLFVEWENPGVSISVTLPQQYVYMNVCVVVFHIHECVHVCVCGEPCLWSVSV